VGIAVSNLCHLLSVLLLYKISRTVFSDAPEIRSSTPFAIAVLHIISPAGAFLAAPCSEALYSSLSFLGYQLYLGGLKQQDRSTRCANIERLTAGAVFGLATAVRSNGLLNGALFLYDAAATAMSLYVGETSMNKLKQLIVTCVGGCFVALGAIIPQYAAYNRYCTLESGLETRPWCNDQVPSIYAWVQHHYW
jgi:GPI mannosyltransferase 2